MVVKPHRMYQLQTGDVLVKISGGGAGVGNPLERDPEKVLQDVVIEFISLEVAREVYGVVINPTTMEIDWEKTEALRAQKGTGKA